MQKCCNINNMLVVFWTLTMDHGINLSQNDFALQNEELTRRLQVRQRHEQHWQGDVDEIILVALPRAGNLPQLRLTGMLVGLKEILPQLEDCSVNQLDGDGVFGTSLNVVGKHLRSSKARQFLVGATNDPSALGALKAFQETGRAGSCAIMEQNATPEGRAEMREPGTRLIGSVGYFPEKYGAAVVRLALDILNHRPVPPAVFAKHHLITPENVDDFYPNDRLMNVAAG